MKTTFDAKMSGNRPALLALQAAAAWLLALFLFAGVVQAGDDFQINSSMSASWFDPAHEGEGFLIEILPGGIAVVYWFTFDDQGNQRWFVGTGTVKGSQIIVDEFFVAEGGTFGPMFDPELVMLDVAGSATFTFDDCDSGRVDYLIDGESGSLNLVRLTALLGVECDPVAGTPPDEITPDKTVVFVGVNVVGMINDVVATNQTVIVKDGVIQSIGDKGSIPADAVVIDGRTRFLMPGLVDLHTHLGAEVTVFGDIGERQLQVYLANGVTTILNQGDFMFPFGNGLMDLVEQARDSLIPSPTIYTASYARGQIDGGTSEQIVFSTQDGRNHVAGSQTASYDFIKVYNNTPLGAFNGIIQEAATRNMAVIGHFPGDVGVTLAYESGQIMAAHTAAYFYSWYHFVENPALTSGAIKVTLDNKAWVNSTLYIEETIAAVWGGNTQAFEEFISQPRMRYVHPLEVAVWRNGVEGNRWNPPGSFPGQLDSRVEFIKQYARDFYDAGIPFTLGTDSPTVLGVPGFSTHEEMRLLEDLGLTPFQILEIATKNGGRFINETVAGSEAFGTIAPGQRADLILLSANPLDDIGNVQTRVGVMARGRWWSEDSLQAMLEAVAKSYGN